MQGEAGPTTLSQPVSVIRAFLIADIRGYTRYSDTRGDEAAARLAQRFVSIVRERVELHAGTVVEVRGDEVLAVFDSARHAVRAAVDLQAGLATERPEDMPLGVGVGIDAGEAVPLGGGYRGRALNIAARLCARARAGEILVTQEFEHLAGTVEGVGFERRGPVRLKGISKPLQLLSVARPTSPGEASRIVDALAGHLEFRLLGPLEVLADGREIPVGGPRQRLVLAHLLLGANRVVSMDDLVDGVWEANAPPAARNTIQSYVSHLRAALGSDRIEGRAPGYVLHATAEELDILRFELALRRARRLLPVEPRDAVVQIGEALELWRGSPLSDLADAPSLSGEIARLWELRLAALEELLGARLGIGEHAEALPDLERLTIEHPLRERLWAHLMLARYRSGRQADALQAYRRAQEILGEELGIDPSPELQELQGRILRQDPALQLTGRPLRGYRLLERVGEGAFGVVWRAVDPGLGREVAVKQIHPRLADDPSFLRRFEQEAQTIARLEHPHIVPLYDYWRDGTGAYLVMRWMRGGDLDEVLAAGGVDVDNAVRVVDHVAAALSAAHRMRTVHRDVKPANVLLDEEGNAYLSDFGIAEDLAEWRDSAPPSSLDYRSPEQLRGEDVTPRSDIYALGLIIQELLGGGRLGSGVADAVGRATADDPADRYADANELAAALREALGLSPPRSSVEAAVEARNPYKGLLPFVEADADDFFGRDLLVDRLIGRLGERVEGSRFLAVIGPSGSGKSSVVRAGLVPTLRRGALPGSDRWFYVEMLPGAHPIEELEAVLLRIGVNRPSSLPDLLEGDDEGLARIVDRLLPDRESQLLLVVDQLEEVFTLVEDEETRHRFLEKLVAAVHERDSRLRVVATLRADFYDRPLSYPGLAELMRHRSETVVPLSPEEIERAISGPAAQVGVIPERTLAAEMVADVMDRPGALPLLQYALTELFDARRDGTMTLEAYREIDGISGALARRAEELFEGSSTPERAAAKQVFLRLVTLGEGQADTRRLVSRGELLSLDVERSAIERTIDKFGRHRLLSFDRDPATRGPTVEVAHEALLSSWERLRIWIDEARDDLRHHRRLATAALDWETSGRDRHLLLRGARLEQLESWSASTDLALSRDEKEYLAASLRQRHQDLVEEEARMDRERVLERRSVRRLRALVAVLAAAALVATGLTVVAVNWSREAQRRSDEATVLGITGAVLSNIQKDPDLSVRLALHAVDLSSDLGDPVPAATVAALHWALQEARIQYPIADAPVATIAGPLGFRGVFDLPVSDLANLGLAHVSRSESSNACQQFFGTQRCPPLPEKFATGIPSIPLPHPAAISSPIVGTSVSIRGVDSPAFASALEQLGDATGIDIRSQESGSDFVQSLEQDPPDIAIFSQPSLVADYASEGRLMDLGGYLDVDQLRKDYSPYLVSMGTVARDGSWPSNDGDLYGIIVGLNLKSLVWYPVPEFARAGYGVPQTWDELVALTDQMRADGRTPWCMGLESGGFANGWPATDWVENLLLGGAGPNVYDRWISHRIPFDHPVVRRAFERFGDVVFDDENLFNGVDGALVTSFMGAQAPMVGANPPQCWLYHFPSFASENLPGGPESVGRTTAAFPFPFPNPHHRDVLLGGGGIAVVFADRPEVREVIRLLVSREFGKHWFTSGEGTFSPNRRFDKSAYDASWRQQAQLLEDALAAGTFRFDGSDVMPYKVGSPRFWHAMVTYLSEGPDSLDRILADLEAAWREDA